MLEHIEVYVKTNDIWSFFHENLERLEESMVLITENKLSGTQIYLTEASAYPEFKVYKGGTLVDEEVAISNRDTQETFQRLCIEHIIPKSIEVEVLDDESEPDMTEEQERQMLDDTIYEREDAIQLALFDFLETLLSEGDYRVIDSMSIKDRTAFFDSVIDAFCMYLAEDHDIYVYRPMWLEDPETGETIFEEYPYGYDGDDE